MASDRYLPALRFSALTRFIDPFIRMVLPEQRFKQRLIEQVTLEPRQRILDLGCGTGTLAILVESAQPKAEVIGLDADPEMFTGVRLFDGFERTRENAAGALPRIFEQAGLAQAMETDRMRTAFGTLSFYRARKPLDPTSTRSEEGEQ